MSPILSIRDPIHHAQLYVVANTTRTRMCLYKTTYTSLSVSRNNRMTNMQGECLTDNNCHQRAYSSNRQDASWHTTTATPLMLYKGRCRQSDRKGEDRSHWQHSKFQWLVVLCNLIQYKDIEVWLLFSPEKAWTYLKTLCLFLRDLESCVPHICSQISIVIHQ